MGIFLTCDWSFLLLMKCEMDIFTSWIWISIVAINHDFPKCIVLFSMKHEVFVFLENMIYIVYLPLNLLYLCKCRINAN